MTGRNAQTGAFSAATRGARQREAMDNAIPKTVPGMIALARAACERLHETQHALDLFAAVLATAHVADWFIEGELGSQFRDEQETFWERFPVHRCLWDLANGLKHGLRPRANDPTPARRLVLEPLDTPWRHPDFWPHGGRNIPVWQVECPGLIPTNPTWKMRSVYCLCDHFLNEFEAWVGPLLPGNPRP